MTLLPILLPEGYNIKVSTGQEVKTGDVLAKQKSGAKDEVVHLARDLKISPKKAIKTLKKKLGSYIDKGDVIAVKKGKLGIGKKQIISEFSGTLLKIDNDTGDLFVRVVLDNTEDKPVISPVDGSVDFCDNEKIVLKTDRATVLAEETNGKSGKGNLLVLEKTEVEDQDVAKEVSENIVAAESFEKAAIFKILAIGGLGIITLSRNKENLEDVLAKNLNKPLFFVSNESFEDLKKYKNREVSLDADNKIISVL
jgi:hypothetical protein